MPRMASMVDAPAPPTTTNPTLDVVVIGAGFSGIGAAIALSRAGIENFVLLEDGDGAGGAWHWNTYPGVAVDIPSFSYQFSYRQRADWSRVYALGDELKAYAEHCIDHYGLRSRIRLNTRVTEATWDDGAHLWQLSTATGDIVKARHVIGATGVFTKPKPPEVPGLEPAQGRALLPRLLYADHDRVYEHAGLVAVKKEERWLIARSLPGLAEEVVAAAGWPPRPTANGWRE